MQYIAYVVKGLENIAQEEICTVLPKVTITQTDHKRIIFQTAAPYSLLLNLRTVDDLGIVLKTTQVTSLDELLTIISNLNLSEYKQIIAKNRILKDTFSITVSVSRSEINSKEIIPTLSQLIAQKYKWTFTETEHTNLDIRMFIDQTDLIISFRVTSESLHHREYKTQFRPGALRPTIAVAMIRLATNNQPGKKIVDNFCGSGTILCEGLIMGQEVYGGDIRQESVRATQANLSQLKNSGETIKLLDATHTSWPTQFFDCAISNLPWDKQIEVKSISTLYEHSCREFARIIKPNGSVCVLLTKPDLFIKYAKKYFPTKQITEIKLGVLGQTPTLVLLH